MIISTPKHNVIECIALEFAGVWYDAARSSGLKPSKHRTARHFAAHNIEKFMPHAIKHAIDLLGRPDISPILKDEIHQAILERVNDSSAKALAESANLPNIDISKFLAIEDSARLTAQVVKKVQDAKIS